MLSQFAQERGLKTLDIFREAYKKERGYIFGLEGPDVLHALWKKNNLSVPIYVLRYVRHQLEKEPPK